MAAACDIIYVTMVALDTTQLRLIESTQGSSLYVSNVMSIGLMVSKVEGRGPIDPPAA